VTNREKALEKALRGLLAECAIEANLVGDCTDAMAAARRIGEAALSLPAETVEAAKAFKRGAQAMKDAILENIWIDGGVSVEAIQKTDPAALPPQSAEAAPSETGDWLSAEEVAQELVYIEAHDAPNHAMPRKFAAALCRMASWALKQRGGR
jgi:hypothetical protein